MLCIILPEQIVQQGERSDDFSGSFIAVSRDFMDLVIPTMQQLFPMFFMIKERPCIAVTADELQAFEEYHSFLWSKVKLKGQSLPQGDYAGIADGAVLRDIRHLSGTCCEGAHSQKPQGRFVRTLHPVRVRVLQEERSVSFYADKMFLTPKHLSTVVKEVSGRWWASGSTVS